MQCTHPTLFTQWFSSWVVYERSGNWVFTVWEFMTGRVRGWKRIGRKLQHAELNNFFQWKHTSTPSSHRQGVELLPLKKNSNPYCGELAFRISNYLFSAFSFGEGGAVQPNLLCVRVLSSQRSRVAVLDKKVLCRRSSTTRNSCSTWLFMSKAKDSLTWTRISLKLP